MPNTICMKREERYEQEPQPTLSIRGYQSGKRTCTFPSFFFNDPATTEIYTLSLHDALPICVALAAPRRSDGSRRGAAARRRPASPPAREHRSEEHTSELQSRLHLVCRLLLEKKKYCAELPDHRQPSILDLAYNQA